MNIDSYLEHAAGVQKLLLAEGNRPVAYFNNDKIEYMSELVLDNGEIRHVLKSLGLESHLQEITNESLIYKGASQYLVKTLNLNDSIRIEITKNQDVIVSDLNKLSLPGYVADWAQSRKGLIFFYSSDIEVSSNVRYSFIQNRAQNTVGSTLVVSKNSPQISCLKGHSVTLTNDESFLGEDCLNSLDFNTYSLSKDFNTYDPLNLLRLVEKGALILLQSPWSSLEKFIYSLNTWSSQSDGLSKLLLQETLGFVGVKSIFDVHRVKRPIFEVMPLDDEELISGPLKASSFSGMGLSFNQYLYTLLLKREVSLKDAYSCSLDPEGLNSMIDEGDSVYGS